jgi:hypothetical protein
MSRSNRIFVVVVVAWAIVVPFLLAANANAPVEAMISRCTDVAQLNCSASLFAHDFVSVPTIFGSMIGLWEWKRGAITWLFVLIPLPLLWLVGWSLSLIVFGIVADRPNSHRARLRNSP